MRNYRGCRFSNRVSFTKALSCGDAGCLTPCHLAFVSYSCHFFATPHSRLYRCAIDRCAMSLLAPSGLNDSVTVTACRLSSRAVPKGLDGQRKSASLDKDPAPTRCRARGLADHSSRVARSRLAFASWTAEKGAHREQQWSVGFTGCAVAGLAGAHSVSPSVH